MGLLRDLWERVLMWVYRRRVPLTPGEIAARESDREEGWSYEVAIGDNKTVLKEGWVYKPPAIHVVRDWWDTFEDLLGRMERGESEYESMTVGWDDYEHPAMTVHIQGERRFDLDIYLTNQEQRSIFKGRVQPYLLDQGWHLNMEENHPGTLIIHFTGTREYAFLLEDIEFVFVDAFRISKSFGGQIHLDKSCQDTEIQDYEGQVTYYWTVPRQGTRDDEH